MGETSGCGSNAVTTLLMLGNGSGNGVLSNGSLAGFNFGALLKTDTTTKTSDFGNRSPSSQSGGGGHNGCHSPTSSSGSHPQYTAEYLAQLLKDKKQLAAFPNIFLHLERLVDDGKSFF